MSFVLDGTLCPKPLESLARHLPRNTLEGRDCGALVFACVRRPGRPRGPGRLGPGLLSPGMAGRSRGSDATGRGTEPRVSRFYRVPPGGGEGPGEVFVSSIVMHRTEAVRPVEPSSATGDPEQKQVQEFKSVSVEEAGF